MGVDKTQNRKKKTALVYGVNFLLTALLFLLFTVLISSGSLSRLQSNLVILVCINVLMAVSLNLVTGVLGQLVLGHAGFMLVGAYTAALFTKSSGLPLEVALPIGLLLAGLVAAVFSVVIGIPALRLRGDYLAIITLGFGEIIRVVANNLDFIGGAQGLSGIPSPDKLTLFLYSSVLVILAVFLMFTFGRSRHGGAVISIREDEIAAESSGVNTTYYKLMAFGTGRLSGRYCRRPVCASCGHGGPVQIRFQPVGGIPDHGGAGRYGIHHRLHYLRHCADHSASDADGLRPVPYADLFHYSDRSDAVPSHRPVGPVRDFGYPGLPASYADRIKGRSRKKEEV